MYLPCAGEFLAALQIQAAMLGRGRLPRWAAAVLALGLWMISQLLWGDYEAYSARALIFNAARFFAASLLFGGTVVDKLFSVVLCGIIILGYGNLLGSLGSMVWGIDFSETWSMPFSVLIYGVVLNAVAWMSVRVLKKCRPFVDPRQRLAANLYLCVAAGLNVILTAFGKMADQPGLMLLICIGLALSVTVYLILMALFSTQTLQAGQVQAQMKMEQERADALMESYQTQRRLTHEFTNHMDAVNFYLEQGDVEGARAYLASISQRVAAGTAVVNTNNPLLDALLSKEYRKAVQKGVMLQFDLCDLKWFPLRTADLVTVMCNLLDNAVEAAASASPPQITLRIKQMEGEYLVSVRNRVKRDLVLDAGTLPSSTKAESGHGMGLANVCGVLERCGGTYTISCKDRWFCFTFTLPAEYNGPVPPKGDRKER